MVLPAVDLDLPRGDKGTASVSFERQGRPAPAL